MKRDLYFSKPLMNAAGPLGFAPDTRPGIPLDAIRRVRDKSVLSAPTSACRQNRRSSNILVDFCSTQACQIPDSRRDVKRYASRWDKSDLPIIVHLMADRPEETQRMVRMLETHENMMAAELGFAPLLADDIISAYTGNVFGRAASDLFPAG